MFYTAYLIINGAVLTVPHVYLSMLHVHLHVRRYVDMRLYAVLRLPLHSAKAGRRC